MSLSLPVRRVPDVGPPPERSAPEDLPEIVVTHDDSEGLDAVEKILAADELHPIYQRAGVLVRVLSARGSRDQFVREHGDPDAPVIDVAPAPWIRERMSAVAKWKRLRKSGEDFRLVRVDVPERYAAQLLARGEWDGFQHLEGVVDAPTMRRDGSLIESHGYDQPSGLLFIGRAKFPALPVRPSAEDVRAAISRLDDVLHDFPFAAASDRAAAFASILTATGRFAIDGCAPMFFVLAPTPGTGKTLLARVPALIALGREPTIRFSTRDPSETRKALFALALSGARVVLTDNIVGEFGDETWALALTSGVIDDRILGASESRRVSLLGATFFGSGNNVRFRGDCGRRVVPIQLDAQLENPEDRTGFRHPDLTAHVRRERPQLVAAALVILRGFVVAGRPPHGLSRIGSFEAWDDLIRGACIWAGIGDPAAGREQLREEGDADLEALRGALVAWATIYGDQPVALKDVAQKAETDDALRSALSGLLAKPEAKLDSRHLGYALRSLRGRIADQARFERAKDLDRNGVARWRVAHVGMVAGD